MAHEKAVNGEIAALDVFFGCFGINDLVGMAAVRVADIGAEGGDFDFEGVLADENDTELGADIEALWEELKNLLRSGVSGDVVIGGIAMEEDIADAASDEEGLMAVALKSIADGVGEFARIHGMIMRLWGEVNEVEEASVL